jgi:2-polyprenyl-6-methoxyphenol hydroxylase-like FAD-dependent oxidoreductase
LLTERFTGLGWHTDHILAAMQNADDFYFDTISRVVVPEWSRGRVVLVGDAGYCGSPLAGHGTALSLVGAYVLAGELAAAEGDHIRAFPSYQKIMQAYVEQRMELPPGGVNMAMPMTSLGIWLRDTSIRLMTSRLFAGALAKMAVGQPDKIELKEYSVQRGNPVGIAADEAE